MLASEVNMHSAIIEIRTVETYWRADGENNAEVIRKNGRYMEYIEI